MERADRYTGPNGTAEPSLTRREAKACQYASMLHFLETGEYIQFQPVNQTSQHTHRPNNKKKNRKRLDGPTKP